MLKKATLLAILLPACALNAQAEPDQSRGATRVQDNLAANHSDGKASKGLNTALTNITSQHDRDSGNIGQVERTEHPTRPERPEHRGR